MQHTLMTSSFFLNLVPRSVEHPKWNWRNKPENRDFDELNHILQESKKLGKALENLSRSKFTCLIIIGIPNQSKTETSITIASKPFPTSHYNSMGDQHMKLRFEMKLDPVYYIDLWSCILQGFVVRLDHWRYHTPSHSMPISLHEPPLM